MNNKSNSFPSHKTSEAVVNAPGSKRREQIADIETTPADPGEIRSLWLIVSSSHEGHWMQCEKPAPGDPLLERWIETHAAALDLHRTGGDAVFSLVEQAMLSDDRWLQRVGLRIGREMDEVTPKQLDVFRSFVVQFSSRDQPEDVRFEALSATGFVWDDAAFQSIYGMINDPDPDVRYTIAFALRCDTQQSFEALCHLSRDVESQVRDIATWQLGSMRERNCPRLRSALHLRLDDTDDDTRWEAILGLARRKDCSAIPAILKELESGCLGTKVAEAAGLFAKPEFVPYLEGYIDGGDDCFCSAVDWAIAHCRGEEVPHDPGRPDFVESVTGENLD